MYVILGNKIIIFKLTLSVSVSKAVLPECRVNNFTTDWNSGVYLSALLNYCKPGLFPHWRQLDPNDRYTQRLPLFSLLLLYQANKCLHIFQKLFQVSTIVGKQWRYQSENSIFPWFCSLSILPPRIWMSCPV